MNSLILYNLYPGLFKNVDQWISNIERIKNMGFNAIYINPFHMPGFSGSLYSVKDYYAFNELFFSKDSSPDEQLKKFISSCKDKGIDVYMDLVISHTAIDSVLVNEHRDWYKLDADGNIVNPGAWEEGKWVTWGDLASFDLESSKDKYSLWDYLLEMGRYYLNFGFKGFRCDAAYQVPVDFWNFFITNIKKSHPETIFLAETLGCTPVQIKTVASCGFHYIFNSSKWWDFIAPWCLEQYDLTRVISPSISFPETHDTNRLMEESKGNIDCFLQRIYFEAIFSKGFMITSGLEYGARKRISTVTTRYTDWENTGLDFSEKIKNIISIKNAFAPLKEESPIYVINQANWQNVFSFVKEWEGEKVLVVLNKDKTKEQNVQISNIEAILSNSNIKDYSPESRLDGYIKDININLKPCEIKIFGSENKSLEK